MPPEPEPPTLEIDVEITDGRVLTYSLLEQLQQLEPFGADNPEPVFASRGVLVVEARRCGKDGGTFQMTVRLPGREENTACVWFRSGEWASHVQRGDEVAIAYKPKINVYRERMSIQLELVDMKLLA